MLQAKGGKGYKHQYTPVSICSSHDAVYSIYSTYNSAHHAN